MEPAYSSMEVEVFLALGQYSYARASSPILHHIFVSCIYRVMMTNGIIIVDSTVDLHNHLQSLLGLVGNPLIAVALLPSSTASIIRY